MDTTPQDYRRLLHTWIPTHIYEDIQRKAENLGISMTAYIRLSILIGSRTIENSTLTSVINREDLTRLDDWHTSPGGKSNTAGRVPAVCYEGRDALG